jgi:hypothetical protein
LGGYVETKETTRYALGPWVLLQAYNGRVSVFDDWQPVMGVPGTLFGGLRRMQNSTVNVETTIYTGSVRQNSILRPVWV